MVEHKILISIEAITKGMEKAKDDTKGLAKWLQKFPGAMMSIMFLGMTLKRTFGGFLDTSVQLYRKLTENQTLAGKAMMKMSAAWGFLKFAIVDALSPLIIYFAELFTNISDFVSLNPELVEMIANFVVLGVVAGVAFFTIGSLVLGLWGLLNHPGLLFLAIIGILIVNNWEKVGKYVLPVIAFLIDLNHAMKVGVGVLAFVFMGLINVLWKIGKVLTIVARSVIMFTALLINGMMEAIPHALGWLLDKVIGVMEAIITRYNAVRSLFGMKPIEMNFSGLRETAKNLKNYRNEIGRAKIAKMHEDLTALRATQMPLKDTMRQLRAELAIEASRTPGQDFLYRTTSEGEPLPLQDIIINQVNNMSGVYSTSELDKYLDEKKREWEKDYERQTSPR